NWTGDTVTVLFNNGGADFSVDPGSPYAVGSHPRDIQAADLNGDCAVDLICTNQFGNTCSILFNNGLGSFTVGLTPVATGLRPSFLALGDVDWDGDLDLAVSNEDSDQVWVMLNDGAGNFGGPSDVHTITDPENIAFTDLDSDRDLDIVVVTQESVL